MDCPCRPLLRVARSCVPPWDTLPARVRGGFAGRAAVDRRGVPQWIELDKAGFKGVVKSLPERGDVTLPIREQLIIELYSK